MVVTVLNQPLTEAEKKHRELLLQSDGFKDLYPHRHQKADAINGVEAEIVMPTSKNRPE